jgi:hypothetical protein
MRLEYISHSCFVIDTGGKRIAFDPWITGTAYFNQWFLYPEPLNTESVESADLILISHGHEDHLHSESLQKINKNAHIFFPFQWREGITSYFGSLGFSNVTEAISFRTYKCAGIKITYLGYSLESVIVVESEGIVIVNINDALNSNHETAVSFLLEKIKSLWPKVDFLLSGWSGAGYFPNKVHYRNKNDIEVAKIREQYFANNFCRFAEYIQPETAIAFAPGFILLNKENEWINEIKFPRSALGKYYAENYKGNISFPIMYPGDFISGKEFCRVSDYHNTDDSEMYKNLLSRFPEKAALANETIECTEVELQELILKLEYWVNKNKSIYHRKIFQDLHFSILLTDVSENNYLNISSTDELFSFTRSASANPADKIKIRTKASLLLENFHRGWGGDLLTIGYGIDVDVYDEDTLEKNLDIVCVRLISRYPLIKDDLLRQSGRALKYYMINPSISNLWLQQKLKLRPYVNKYPFNERDHWITYNKCDLCQVCKMPELDFEKLAFR